MYDLLDLFVGPGREEDGAEETDRRSRSCQVASGHSVFCVGMLAECHTLATDCIFHDIPSIGWGWPMVWDGVRRLITFDYTYETYEATATLALVSCLVSRHVSSR